MLKKVRHRTSFLPVGGLLFIAEDANEDTAEEADEAVIVGGDGDDEKCADISGDIFVCLKFLCALFVLCIKVGPFRVVWLSDVGVFCGTE